MPAAWTPRSFDSRFIVSMRWSLSTCEQRTLPRPLSRGVVGHGSLPRWLVVRCVRWLDLSGHSRNIKWSYSARGNHTQENASWSESEAQLQCLLCHQIQVRSGGKWVWVHWFSMNSGEDCAADPGEMCRMCGGSSTCHTGQMDDDGNPDVGIGQCHSTGCAPLAMRTLSAEVSRLAYRMDARTGPMLALKIASDPRLSYDERQNTVALRACEGTVVRQWHLDLPFARPPHLMVTETLESPAVETRAGG